MNNLFYDGLTARCYGSNVTGSMDCPNPLSLWRQRHQLSNEQAGKLFGVDKGRWWRIENGHIRPEDDLESRIVLATGVTRDQLACLRKQQGERVREKKRA